MKVTLLTCRKCGGTKLETEVVLEDERCMLYYWCTRCSLCLLAVEWDMGVTGWDKRVSVSLTVKER